MMANSKNSAAVTLGRLGGQKGGKARAEFLCEDDRRAIARKAANKRWGNRIDNLDTRAGDLLLRQAVLQKRIEDAQSELAEVEAKLDLIGEEYEIIEKAKQR